jgi:arylmalonate decarboxylase
MARCRVGVIGPVTKEFMLAREENGDASLRGERLLPADIEFVHTGFALTDYTSDGVEAAVARYWERIDELSAQGVDRIGWIGFPISAQLGRARCLELMEATTTKTGLPSYSDAEDLVDAFRHLGVRRLAVASRWADALNQRVKQYLEHAGFEVLTMTSEGQWARQAFTMSLDSGIKLAFELSRRAMREAPQAEGLFVAGGAWRSLGCLPPLEDEFDVPVVSNPSASIWRVMHDGLAPPVQGWTRLLAEP